jgi:uncharacterized membrane protein YeaQ/YmgE (transglycosylase-associated protein family)
MELLALLAAGIISGHIASLLYGGYSLGALGNSIAGLTGAIFLGKHLSLMFDLSQYLGMFAGGALGAFVILAVFSAGESFAAKKTRLF